jgi:UDP-GlcNAc:undecaprenyl-phosphate/decaprenyl-phosphate GlcNAc-1-phosphate transferase
MDNITTLLNYPYFGVLVTAFLIADLIFPSIMRMCRRIGAIDRPGGHKAQKHPTPFLGGVGVCIAIATALLLTIDFSQLDKWMPFVGIWAGGIFVLALGVLDDWKPVNAVVKLALLFLASIVVIACGVRANLFAGAWGMYANIAITLLWIAGITSAFNSIDNTDGAAGGTASVASLGVCVIGLVGSDSPESPYLVAFACAVLGACLGFLRYNWPKARIYLGDNGSFFVGFTLASLLLMMHWSQSPLRSAAIPVVLMTVPLLDICLSTLLRYQRGIVRTIREAIVYCGHDHLAHRLKALGMSRQGASAALWGIGAVSAAEAVALCTVKSEFLFWLVLAGHAGFVALLSVILARAPVYELQRRKDALARRYSQEVVPVASLKSLFCSHLSLVTQLQATPRGAAGAQALRSTTGEPGAEPAALLQAHTDRRALPA